MLPPLGNEGLGSRSLKPSAKPLVVRNHQLLVNASSQDHETLHQSANGLFLSRLKGDESKSNDGSENVDLFVFRVWHQSLERDWEARRVDGLMGIGLFGWWQLKYFFNFHL